MGRKSGLHSQRRPKCLEHLQRQTLPELQQISPRNLVQKQSWQRQKRQRQLAECFELGLIC